MDPKQKTTSLIAASILGLFLLNAPILIYFQDGTVAGIPSLVMYTYGAWLLLIVLFIVIIRYTRTEKKLEAQDD